MTYIVWRSNIIYFVVQFLAIYAHNGKPPEMHIDLDTNAKLVDDVHEVLVKRHLILHLLLS